MVRFSSCVQTNTVSWFCVELYLRSWAPFQRITSLKGQELKKHYVCLTHLILNFLWAKQGGNRVVFISNFLAQLGKWYGNYMRSICCPVRTLNDNFKMLLIVTRMIKNQKMTWPWNEQHYWRSDWEEKEKLYFESSNWKQRWSIRKKKQSKIKCIHDSSEKKYWFLKFGLLKSLPLLLASLIK